MEENNKFNSAKKLITEAKSVIVILPPDPNKDLISAALSLHFSFKESGKLSQIGCGSDVHKDSKIPGSSDITTSIGNRNLIISFDYKEEHLDKVDYDVREDGKFYLLVKPKEGSPAPDIASVKYAYSGANADLVITLGISTLEELGKIYAEEKAFLDNAQILSLNISPKPSIFTPHFCHVVSSTFTELVTVIVEKAEMKLPSETASVLLNGIYESTSNLTSSNLTADTFSSIAYLMRQGARLPSQKIIIPKFTQAPFFEVPLDQDQLEENKTPESVPQDWKQPKIFRASSL